MLLRPEQLASHLQKAVSPFYLLHGDAPLFTSLYRTADLFGVPVTRPSGRRFLSGGPLGNAILLTMTTATWAWKERCARKVGP